MGTAYSTSASAPPAYSSFNPNSASSAAVFVGLTMVLRGSLDSAAAASSVWVYAGEAGQFRYVG